jgi:methionyl-tRNA formyltransferase
MSEKGYKSLLYFLRHFDSKHIDFIVCAKDSNVLQDFSDEIVNLAKENGVTYYFRNQEFEIKSKYLIAISWRWIIKSTKDSILITIHDSILPKYRGFSPLVNQLINKEPYIGATAIISNDEYDKGDIIAQNKIKITYPIRVNDAISKIINSYEEIILKICSNKTKVKLLIHYGEMMMITK